MIALDTNVLVRYLARDDAEQAEAARALLEELTEERPGFVCREVMVELVRVLRRTYGISRSRVTDVLEELVLSKELEVEAGIDVASAALRYRQGIADFSDLMISAAAERSGASALYTFDRKAARLDSAVLLAQPTV